MKPRLPGPRTGGFTLLELTIGIALLISLIAVIAVAFKLEGRTVRSGAERMESLERLRAAIYFFNAQIRSYAPPVKIKEAESVARTVFTGAEKYFQLPSNYSVWNGIKGCVVAEYRVEAGENGKQSVYLYERDSFFEDRRRTLLIGALDEASFEYWYRDLTGEEGRWIGTWSDEAAAPDRVRIRLACRGKRFSMDIPVLANRRPPIATAATTTRQGGS